MADSYREWLAEALDAIAWHLAATLHHLAARVPLLRDVVA